MLTCPGETIEAAIIVSVLLSFVEQLMVTGRFSGFDTSVRHSESNRLVGADSTNATTTQENDGAKQQRIRALIKRMRLQIWAGTICGFVVALAIGGAFIAVVRPLNP